MQIHELELFSVCGRARASLYVSFCLRSGGGGGLSVQLRIKIPAPVAAGALQGHDAAGEAKDLSEGRSFHETDYGHRQSL